MLVHVHAGSSHAQWRVCICVLAFIDCVCCVPCRPCRSPPSTTKLPSFDKYHNFDYDQSGCLDRAEAFDFGEYLRGSLYPEPLADFGACASASNLSMNKASSQCISGAALAAFELCLTAGRQL